MALADLMAEELALTSAALFTGAAIYISVAEQPARLRLPAKEMLEQWKPSYARGFAMQASLALASGLFGLLAVWFSHDWRWFVGAALIIANWPYTLLIILPINKRLDATDPDEANVLTQRLIAQWGRLHAGRSALGLAATLSYLWALAAA
jgi:hypothetical protein